MITVVDMQGSDEDARPDRDRVKPCPRRTWCVDVENHLGSCTEAPRLPHPPPDYGPKRNA